MSTTTDQTSTPQDAAPTLTLDYLDCMSAIDGLRKMLATRSLYEIEDSSDDPDFASFATSAVGLARLATALHAYKARPRQAGAGTAPTRRPETVAALRAQIAVTISDLDTPDPDILLSRDTMHGFAWALREAVTACPLPNEEDVDEEAGQAWRRLSGLALALSQAAGAAGTAIYQRVHDREKALGLFPYDRS